MSFIDYHGCLLYCIGWIWYWMVRGSKSCYRSNIVISYQTDRGFSSAHPWNVLTNSKCDSVCVRVHAGLGVKGGICPLKTGWAPWAMLCILLLTYNVCQCLTIVTLLSSSDFVWLHRFKYLWWLIMWFMDLLSLRFYTKQFACHLTQKLLQMQSDSTYF